MTRRRITGAALWLAALLVSCDTRDIEQLPQIEGLGRALPDLPADLRARFERGRVEMLEVEEEAEGLGPLYNGRSCAECHSAPALGGHGSATVTRVGKLEPDGTFVAPPGGTLMFAFSTRPELVRSEVPMDANVLARRVTPPLFGLGLIEAIPDEEILAQAARTDRGAGVAGRAARVVNSTGVTRVGRFGSKAQRATLFDFCGDAYQSELGITNEVAGEENVPGGDLAAVAAVDRLAEPEASAGTVGRLADFVRLLAPVAPSTNGASAGATLFRAIGCEGCHRPAYRTAPDAGPGLADREVRLYSDLLLHDIGTGDGIAQGAASPSEQRTTPLWGLRFRRQLLHDGSALGPRAAIAAHRNEADASRVAFFARTPAEQAAVLMFLGEL